MTYKNSTIEYFSKPTGSNFQDLEGQRFNRLVVICYGGLNNGTTYWFCQCDCGMMKKVAASPLKQGMTQSCGCLHKERCSVTHLTHGESIARRSPEYRSYMSAKNRCTNVNNARFHHYGGRGIEFRFTSFEEFIAYMGRRPTLKYTLERIDVNGHYEKGNITWATWKEQQRNRRNNRLIQLNGKMYTAPALMDKYGIPADRIRRRIVLGWCPQCAIFNPPWVPCAHLSYVVTD